MNDRRILHGDCRVRLSELEPNSIDACVTDPPYGLEFMGKEWDRLWDQRPHGGGRDNHVGSDGSLRKHFMTSTGPTYVAGKAAQEWHESWAVEVLRVLKPGAHLLAFGGTRTYHRMTCALEDAGFEIRDCLMWLYGSGFPKSLDVSKAIDKANGRKFEDRYALGRHIRDRREALGLSRADVNGWFGYSDGCEHWERQDPNGARVPALADWRTLQSRLGLSNEYLPLIERAEAERSVIGSSRNWGKRGDVPVSAYGEWNITTPTLDAAQQWQGWGTALKPAYEPIVLARKPLIGTVAANVQQFGTGAINVDGCRVATVDTTARPGTASSGGILNVVPGGCVRQSETHSLGRWPANIIHDGSEDVVALFPQATNPAYHVSKTPTEIPNYGGASSRVRPVGVVTNYGDSGSAARFFYCAKASRSERGEGNTHPTVKPQALLRYLIRLITPPHGLVLDPFAGSGSTALAALEEGCRFLGIEQDAGHTTTAEDRVGEAAFLPFGAANGA